LGLPEYFGFGTNTSLPSVLKRFSRQAPSTMVQTGLVV
jgi:hypothetical protein